MAKSGQLGTFTQTGMFAGGMAVPQANPNGVVTPPGVPLVQNQVAYPNASGQLTGDPTLTYDPVAATLSMTGAETAASGIQNAVVISPSIAQSGTAGYTALVINPVQGSTGSGVKNLQTWGVGGVVSAMLTNTGAFGAGAIRAGAATSPASTLETIGSFGTAAATIAASQALTVSQCTVLVNATGGAVIATLPTAASANRRIYTVKKIDVSANTVTIQANGAETIDGTNTKVLTAQYQSLMIQSDGTSWWII